MNRYGRIEGRSIVEVIELPLGVQLSECFHAEIASQFVAIPSNVEAGWLVENDGFIPLTPIEVDLTTLKSALKTQIDLAAEAERLKYITPGAGQAMTYQQKVDEARAFKSASNPQATDYPVLSSEVGITAPALNEVADIILTAFAQWQQIGAMIESVRLGAKRDIDAAADEAAARDVVDAIEWPQPAL